MRTHLLIICLVGLILQLSGCELFFECDPDSEQCRLSLNPSPDSGTCDGCTINGVCVAKEASNPSNGCQICSVSVSATAWSDLCDQICTVQGGVSTCSCDSGYDLNDDQRTCDDVDECNLGTDTCLAIETCFNTPGSSKTMTYH